MKDKQYMNGGLYAIECTHTHNGWHLHLHIVYEGKYIPQAYISNLWREITNGAFIVYITKVQTHKATFNYILSYLSKQQKIDPKYRFILAEFFDQFRTIQTFGDWYFKTDSQTVQDLKPTVCPHCGKADCWVSARTMEYQSYHAMHEKGNAPPGKILVLNAPLERRFKPIYHESQQLAFA